MALSKNMFFEAVSVSVFGIWGSNNGLLRFNMTNVCLDNVDPHIPKSFMSVKAAFTSLITNPIIDVHSYGKIYDASPPSSLYDCHQANMF